MECFRLLLEYLALIEHQFLSDIRDSREAGSLWGMMRSVGGIRKSINQSWLAKGLGLGLGLLCWGFKGGSSGRDSVERGQHSSNRVSGIYTRTMHQSITPSLSQTIWTIWASRQSLTLPRVQTMAPATFGCRYETIEETKEAVTKVIDMLAHEDFHGALQNLLERYNKCITAGGGYFEGD